MWESRRTGSVADAPSILRADRTASWAAEIQASAFTSALRCAKLISPIPPR